MERRRKFNETMLTRLESLLLIFIVISFLFLIYPLRGGITKTSQKAHPRTETWIQDLQANFNNPLWFSNNLNETERTLIRQAMDYAIPRQQIIDTILGGSAQSLATPVIPQNGMYFNSSLSARSFNTTKALDLMESVFGYRFNATDNPTTTFVDESKPYFALTALVPNNNPLRIQWANRTSVEWGKIGINVTNIVTSWIDLANRIFNQNMTNGESYDEGGFDVVYIGWNVSPTRPVLAGSWDYIGLNSSVADNLIDTMEKNPNKTKRVQAFHDFQEWFVEYVPKSILHQNLELWGLDKYFEGFNPFLIWNYENWTIGNQSKVTISVPQNLGDFNPILRISSYYDNYVTQSVFPGGLFAIDTPSNDSSFMNWFVRPYLANRWNVSADGLTYFINLHSGLKWHDNEPLNASDIRFTYQAILKPAIDSLYYSYADIINNNSVTVLNETAVKIELTKFEPFFKEVLLTLPIIPAHLLDPAMGGPAYTTWDTHVFNKGNTTHGPVGYGPYKIKSLDTQNELWKLEKWNGFNHTLMGTVAPSLNNISIKLISNAASALLSLYSGEIDVVDKNTLPYTNLETLNSSSTAKPLAFLQSLYQEIGYNLNSPIWGVKRRITFLDHSSISINGDTGFHAQAKAEGWPGNGTATNPYIIENYIIMGNGSDTLIEVVNSTVRFVITNCILNGGKTGILLNNVIGGRISFSVIMNNTGNGMTFLSSNGNLILNNILYKNQGHGISLSSSSSHNNITHNDFITNNPGTMPQAYDDGINNMFSHNYWDDWQTPDSNSDGIVDISYQIEKTTRVTQNSDGTPVSFPNNENPVHLLYPPKVTHPDIVKDPLDGTQTIQWHHARDSYEYRIVYAVEYSDNDGERWYHLSGDISANQLDWDTTTVKDGMQYLIKVTAYSYALEEEDTSDRTFEIDNEKDSNSTTEPGPITPDPGPLGVLAVLVVLLIIGSAIYLKYGR
ncbi:MAG: ABC transporter substrate-binding protein [Candidatus Thorarchaeota archaeon]